MPAAEAARIKAEAAAKGQIVEICGPVEVPHPGLVDRFAEWLIPGLNPANRDAEREAQA